MRVLRQKREVQKAIDAFHGNDTAIPPLPPPVRLERYGNTVTNPISTFDQLPLKRLRDSTGAGRQPKKIFANVDA
jgi:hypothetical protein